MKTIQLKLITTILTIGIFISAFGNSAFASIKVVASVPDLASIAKEIGGDKVSVKSIAKGYQNPHYVDAKPSYILDLNKADLLIYMGLDLEVGWLPILVTGARNSKISSSNSNGNFDTSTLIPVKLDVPKVRIDRSMGDIHPGGNPHFMLDPRYAITVARGIADRLSWIDPENSAIYRSNWVNFTNRMETKIKEWRYMLAPYQGTKVLTYHKTWTYFIDWAGLQEAGTIEQKPGIAPSPKHLAYIIKLARSSDIKLVISSLYDPKRASKIVADKVGIPFIPLPSQVGAEKNITVYTELIDSIVSRLISALK